MASWIIYGSNNVAKATVKELELHDEWMAECYLTISVKSATPIAFAVGDYIDYRGERYTIQYDPNVLKKATSGSYGEGFTYDNIKFVGLQDEVVRCDFNDIVLNDNDIHYSALPTFPFYCESVDDLLDRIQANLEDLYPGQWIIIGLNTVRNAQRGTAVGRAQAFLNAYKQYIDPTGAANTDPYGKQGVAETADNITCWDAMKKVHDDFDLNFIVRGRVIVVGTAGVFTANTFRYGKGNGLYELERIGESDQRIVTRLRAYGSEQNIPAHYYNTINKQVYATVTSILHKFDTTGADFLLDLDFDRKYFTYRSESYPGTTEAPNYIIEMMANDVTVRGYVTKDATTGKCYVYCESVAGDDDRDEPDATKMAAFVQALTANDRLDFVEYVNKDAFGEGHYDYGTGHLPDNMAVSRLMLPGFPTMSLHAWVQAHKDDADKAWLAQAIADGFTFSNEVYRPYIDSPNKNQYGVRPGSIYFDGSDDTEDVHPTIEGMTYNGAPIDEVYAADQVEDNGVYPAGEEVKNIKITLPVLGFELDKVYEDGASIDMKNGMCGARSFKMAGTPKKDANGRWVCTVERVHDDALDLWFPYCDFQIHGSSEVGREHGDNYVLTGIEMPAAYIEAASVRLLQESIEALKKNHAPRYTYQPRIDELWMQRQHDTAISSQGVVSLHDTLKAGDIFAFADTDLNIDANVIIDVLTIRENGNNGLPTYEVTLRDEKQVGTIQKITNKVDSIISGATAVNGATGGGLTARQVQSLIDRFGGEQFLSKLNDDTAAGYIKMLKGLQVGNDFASGILGEGGVLRKRTEDGKVELEVDILYARMKAYFDTVEVREYQHTGGNRIASVAGNRICRVEYIKVVDNVETIVDDASEADFFRCYFRATDGEDTVRNNWVVGDLAYCHITSIANSSDNPEQKGLNQKHLWRLVIGRNADNVLTEDGEGYIDLSNRSTETISSESYAGYQSGSDTPAAQDDIIQLGNVNDTTRQGAIVEFVTGTDTPSYQIFQNINSFSLSGKNQIGFGYNTSTGRAYLNVYGDFRFGARPNTQGSYLEYNSQTGALNIKAHVEFTNSDQELDSLVQSHQRDDSYDDSWIQPALDELQDQIDGQIDSWFYNYSPVHVDAQGAPDSTVPLNVEPYSDWDTDDKKIAHLGDTFTNNTTGYCWRFSRNSETNAFEWVIIEDSAVITALQNAARAQETADGKRTTYSVWGAWVKNNVNTLKTGDLFIPAADTTQGGVTYKARKVYKCTTDGSATFSEINYTDDTYAHNFDYLKAAMKGDTQIQGGLLLSNAVVLRNVEQGVSTDIMSGINGVLNTDLVNPLKSIAAWYGGDMLDREAASDSSSSSSEEEEEPRYATSLFRFDGSGYLASGNITWNDQGQITIKNITTLSDSQNTNLLNELATFNSAFHFTTGGQGGTTILSIDPQVQFSTLHIGGSTDDYLAATRKWVGDNYISKTWFNKFFKVHYKDNGTDAVLDPNNDFPAGATDKNIEAIFSFWTNYAISALGQGVDGSHAIGSLNDLSDVELTSPAADQILKFDGTHWVNAAAPQTYVLPQATANALGGIKIGYSGTGKNYPIVLDNDGKAYVNVPWTDYTLPAASSAALGGIMIGYNGTTAKTYAVQLDTNNKAYVAVNWDDAPTDYWHTGDSRTANTVLAAPNGSNGAATFRALVAADIPSLAISKISGLQDALDSKLDKSFFHNLFRAHKTVSGVDTVISANGDLTDAESIEAMFGFWTEQYISALGQGSDGGGGGSTTLYGLNDVSKNAAGDGVLGAADGYVLTYNASTNHWYAAATAETYVLPQATSGALGGIKIGYNDSTPKTYAVALNSAGQAYVAVPWENTTYTNGTGLTLTGTTFSISQANVSTILNLLSEGGSLAEADDYLIAQYAGGGTTNTTYYRRKVSKVVNATIVKAALGTGSGTTKFLREDGNWATPAYPTNYYASDASRTANTVLAAPNGSAGAATFRALVAADIPSLDASKITTGTLSASRLPDLSGTYAAVGRVSTLEGYFTSGVANTAAKLSTTSKTAWGRTFWTAGGVPDSISGALESVTNITMSGYIKIGSIYIGEDSNGDLEIYKLSNGSHVAANLYARGGVSALGQSSSGGGGGQGDVTWELLKQTADTDRWIDSSYISGALANYLPLSGDTMSGSIFFGGTSSAFNSSGIRFKNGNTESARIGGDTANGLGLYATGSVYIRPNVTLGDTSTNGLVITSSSFTYNGNNVLTASNSSVSKSGSTLSVKINGTTQSLENTWRGIQNNLTSTSTTDSLSAYQGKLLNDKFADYVKLSDTEQTITSTISSISKGVVEFYRAANDGFSMISFANKNSSGTKQTLGYIGFLHTVGSLTYRDTSGNQYTIWHAGNDGSGSGLDADTLDGYHASSFASASTRYLLVNGTNYQIYSPYNTTINLDDVYVNISGTQTISGAKTFSATSGFEYSGIGTGTDNVARPIWFSSSTNGVVTKGRPVANDDFTYNPSTKVLSVGSIISSLSGNASTATTLQTSRTIWGQSFNGSANVDGTMNITGTSGSYTQGIRIHNADGFSSIWFGCTNADGYQAGMWGISVSSIGMRFRGNTSSSATTEPVDYMNITYGGNVGIGTNSPSYKLHVVGDFYVNGVSYINSSGINDITSNVGLLVSRPTNWTGISSTQWGVGAYDCEGVIRSSASALKHYRYGDGTYDIIDSKGGQTIANNLTVGSSHNAYIKIGAIKLIYDSNNDALHIEHTTSGKVANFYAQGGISALGSSGSGGGGGGQGDVTWDLLKSSDTRQINISHLAGDANYAGVMSILTGYTTSGQNYKVQEDSNHHLYVNVPWSNTTYTNGTGLALSSNTFSINSTYQTYISHGESAYNSLSSYLPLSGGTMSGDITLGTNHYIYGVYENYGALLSFDGTRTIVGSFGASTTAATHLRSITGHLTVGSDNTASYTILDTGNWSSYIGVNNVTQTLTNSGNTAYRPVLVGASNSGSNPPSFSSITSSVYATSNVFIQPSTGDLTFFAASGASPYLYFVRGGLNNLNYTSYRINVTDGDLHIQNNWTTGVFGDVLVIKDEEEKMLFKGKQVLCVSDASSYSPAYAKVRSILIGGISYDFWSPYSTSTVDIDSAITSKINAYYWANLKLSTTSSTTTIPTFGEVQIKGSNNGVGSDGDATNIWLRVNGAYVNFAKTENAFRRGTGTASESIALGTSTYPWAGLYTTSGNITGSLTVGSDLTVGSVLNVTGAGNYAEGIRIHHVNGISSLWFGASNNYGYDAGMWAITVSSDGMRFRGTTSTSGTSTSDYINILHGGNVGIGKTDPNYKLEVAGNISLYSASGDSPYLYFNRGTSSDSYNDWRINCVNGALNFNMSSSGTWSTTPLLQLSPIAGTAYLYGSTILTSTNYSSNISQRALTIDGTAYSFYAPYTTTITVDTTRVTQSVTSSSNTDKRPIIVGASSSSSDTPTFSATTSSVYATHSVFIQPSTGNLYLYNATEGDSPALYFQRGDMSANAIDWRMYVSSGHMYFQNNSGSWNTMLELQYNGFAYLKGHLLPQATHTYTIGDSTHVWERAYVRYIDTDSNYNLRLCTAGTERILVDYSTGNVGIGTSSPSYKLHVEGTGYFSDNLTFANNKGICINSTGNVSREVMRMTDGNVLVIGGGSSSASNNTYLRGYSIYFKYGTSGTTGMYLSPSGSVGIGTTSPSVALHVVGDIYATGGVTALVATSSDIRKKNVVSYDLPLTLNQIANAPTIKFTWKDNAQLGEQVGSIAQYWQKVLPQTIRTEKDDTLSLQYGVAALVSSIITARKVVDHEERIKALEKECADWKQAYSFLEKAYNELKHKIA